jgi:hypothetical protein
MLKTIFYAFLIYLAYRIIRGLLQARIIFRQFTMNSQTNTRNAASHKPEGSVHIETQTNSSNTKTDNLGEYVDYEEIKD